MNEQTPVTPKLVTLEIQHLDAAGLGVGRAEQRTVKAHNALPGEQVSVQVIKRRHGTWYGLAQTHANLSPQRRPTPCVHFAECGGCSLQHLAPAAQLALKTNQIQQALTAAGLQPAQWQAPITGAELHYRRKARLGVRYLADKDELLVGFRQPFGSRVARMQSCPVLVQPFASLIQPLQILLRRLSCPRAIPQVELAAGEVTAGRAEQPALILRHLQPLTEADKTLLAEFASHWQVQWLLQPGDYSSLHDLSGATPAPLSYSLPAFDLRLAFTPAGFVQINHALNRDLVAAAVAALAPAANEPVLDLFCGMGNFSLALARAGARVLGLEGSAALVAQAQQNAAANGLAGQANFQALDLYADSAAAWTDSVAACDKLLLDPPRSGAGPALTGLLRLAPGKIVYVSCHPESFVRDAAALVQAGYRFQSLQLFDMFPHTTHVEVLAVFENEDKW